MDIALGGKKVSDADLERLQALAGLSSLGLWVNDGISNAGLQHLSNLRSLRHLDVAYTKVSDEGLRQLELLTDLVSLNMRGLPVTDDGLARLKPLTNLQQLYLAKTSVTDDGLENLKQLTQLKKLELRETVVGDAGLRHLDELRQLDLLDLDRTRATPSGVAELQKALPSCRIRFGSVEAAEWVLSLGGKVSRTDSNGLGNIEIAAAKDVPYFEHFALLSVGLSDKQQVADGDLQRLAWLVDLNSLQLNGTSVTDAGLKHLYGLHNLKDLNLTSAKVTADGVKKLAAALPQCKIEWDGGTIEPSADLTTSGKAPPPALAPFNAQ